MNTSKLIEKLVESLASFGDLPTNVKNISWFCPSENGSFEEVHLHIKDKNDLESKGEE